MTVLETAQRERAASLEELRAKGRLVVGLNGHTVCLLAEGDDVYVDLTPQRDPVEHQRQRLQVGLERNISLVVAKARLLVVVSCVENDRPAVLADEVVVPHGEAAALVRDVLIEQVVGLARAHACGREGVDEVAPRAHCAHSRT